jgi:hypothetical protein
MQRMGSNRRKQAMKKNFVLTCVMFFTLTGYATAQNHPWPPTDPDPYFKKRDAEKASDQERGQSNQESSQGDSN